MLFNILLCCTPSKSSNDADHCFVTTSNLPFHCTLAVISSIVFS